MPRILIVEDEPAIADALTYALGSEGLTVVGVRTLGEARNALVGIDLIVLDVGLPDGNGFDFCRDLRRTSRIPVLFLTARADEIDRVVGLEIGGDDYVVKPFSPREVAARVRAILRRSGDVTVVQPGLVLDEARRQARWRDVDLNLTPYQFRLLAVLAAEPGQIFSRSRLLDLVWDDPTASTDRGVDHLVKGIRARFREVGVATDPIRTLRGDGYALDFDGA